MNLDSVQITEEIRFAVACVDSVEFAWRALIGEVRKYRVRPFRQHVRQSAGVRQKVADANRLALVLQVRIVALQIHSHIIVQSKPALQDGIGHQGSCHGLAQRTDFIEGRIGRRTWPVCHHVAAMADELLAPVYHCDRGRVQQRLLQKRCCHLFDVSSQIPARYIRLLNRAARGQQRDRPYPVVEPPHV
ncbi:hypothetical protein ABB29_05825 [Pseudoxanthomonas dokdonensis]|uniref:Uncharacterized protein n=1 Tax=Pseudoxanthomonas dokdonensis TaxID=344882 RepID=A0A0R0CME1_9GAMM|nr:hypothetical protein ABB29_05825 [Pseudoxanthomonas dokdonensis]